MQRQRQKQEQKQKQKQKQKQRQKQEQKQEQKQKQKQIPFGDDNQKGKGDSKCNSFNAMDAMEERKVRSVDVTCSSSSWRRCGPIR